MLGRYEGLIPLLTRVLEYEPDDEATTHLLMIVLGLTGRRGESIRVFDNLVAHLGRTLAMQPMDKLVSLRDAIQRGDSVQMYLQDFAPMLMSARARGSARRPV